MKIACTVLEGESGGNPADLLGKHYVEGYKFMDIQTNDEGKTYYITWADLCAVLETPVIKKLVLDKEAKGGRRKR